MPALDEPAVSAEPLVVPAPNCPPLSAGACKALSSVLARLLSAPFPEASGGAGLVLGGDDEVVKAAAEEMADVARGREARRERRRFEGAARVVPDAATGAAIERKLRETGTRGVVALFNAVRKAQKGGEEEGEVVSKEGFLEMVRKGIGREEGVEDGERLGADWMKDDYATKGSGKTKAFLREDAKAGGGRDCSDSGSGESDASDLESEMEAEVESDEMEED